MARRKISLQKPKQTEVSNAIDNLVKEMGTSDLGFSPTEQIIYEVDLGIIRPDFSQPRHFLPFDLRQDLFSDKLTPQDAIKELITRAKHGDTLATLILGKSDGVEEVENDKSLMALATSIRIVGLRQPINIYSIENQTTPSKIKYQIGEGERRYWAHQLLLAQGYIEFSKIRCIIDVLPDDKLIIQRRQQAENAARQDLSAISRARSIKQIRDRLRVELGTRVPNSTTIKLPSQRDVDNAVGQEVKTFTGRAIGGRMVRNYVRLLNLSPELQDIVEAAQLTEKQLRPVMRLKTELEQKEMIEQIISERLSSRAVLDRVKPVTPTSSLKRVSRTTVEERLEKRLFQAAMTVHEVLSLGEDTYNIILQTLLPKMKDQGTRNALLSMREVIDLLLSETDIVTPSKLGKVNLATIFPPLDIIQSKVPVAYQKQLSDENLTGIEIMQLLLDWRDKEPVIASVLSNFLENAEKYAVRIQAREYTRPITLQQMKRTDTTTHFTYQVLDGKIIYWAYILLVLEGNDSFQVLKAEITN